MAPLVLQRETASSVMITVALMGMTGLVSIYILARGFHLFETAVIPFVSKQYRWVKRTVCRPFAPRPHPTLPHPVYTPRCLRPASPSPAPLQPTPLTTPAPVALARAGPSRNLYFGGQTLDDVAPRIQIHTVKSNERAGAIELMAMRVPPSAYRPGGEYRRCSDNRSGEVNYKRT